MSINSSDTIGTRNRHLPVCSAVPEPTAPVCSPKTSVTTYRNIQCYNLTAENMDLHRHEISNPLLVLEVLLTAVLSKIQGFWNVMPCRLVDICGSFEKFHMTLSPSFKDVFIFRVHQNSPFICNERRFKMSWKLTRDFVLIELTFRGTWKIVNCYKNCLVQTHTHTHTHTHIKTRLYGRPSFTAFSKTVRIEHTNCRIML